jgi:hypothetical protein
LRKPHHEVEADVVEPGSPGVARGATRAVSRVHASKATQFHVVERLHAEAQAVDAQRTNGGEVTRLGCLGVHLQGDLCSSVEARR